MINPIPVVATDSGDVEDAPVGAIPLAAYGFGGGSGEGGVESVNGQTGEVVLDAGDVGAATETYVDIAVGSITDITPQEAPEADATAIIAALIDAGVFTP